MTRAGRGEAGAAALAAVLAATLAAGGWSPASAVTGPAPVATTAGSPAAAPPEPLGVSAPAAAPDVAYVVTCADGQRFQGTLGGSGAARGAGATSHGGIAAGTRCTARLVPTGGLPALTEVLPPVPANGVVTVGVTENLPGVLLSPPLGPPGQPTAVSGAGFPPRATVTLTWSGAQGAPLVVTTDGSGSFHTPDLVLPDAPQGLAQLGATGSGFPTVAASYLVVPPSVEPQGATPIQNVFRP